LHKVPGDWLSGLLRFLDLNLGEDDRRLGGLASAGCHLELGQAAAAVLGRGGDSRMIRGGLHSLALGLVIG